jgi:hypothetical protein
MNNNLIKTGILVLIVLVTYSCKKYDEGPLISLRSKEKRMSGEWDIQKFIVDGYDSTSFFNKYDNAHFIFNVDNEGRIIISCNDNGANPKPIIVLNGNWKWLNNKNDISIQFNHSTNDFKPFLINNVSVWEIKKLTSKNFYLETNDNNIQYRLELIH